jgi:hypothetical protein
MLIAGEDVLMKCGVILLIAVAGHPLTTGVSTKIPIFLPTSQQATPIGFSVTGIGGGK